MDSVNLNIYIKGTCEEMCPEKERRMREREKLLDLREILDTTESQENPMADPKKTVKAFSRSAAGRRTASPSELRPLPVLKKTVSFLFSSLKFDRSEDWISEYDFIFDRIRAVSQDAVIQGLDDWDCISLYQSIARFLAFSGYRLSGEPKSKYDPVINSKHLQECLKKILRICDEHNITYPGQIYTLPEFEALYLLVNLGDYEAICRGFEKIHYSRTREFELALGMSLAFWHGNYVRVLKLLDELPLLLSCVVNLHIPAIRRKALKIMCTAYSSRSLSFPSNDLSQILHYSTEDHLVEDCTHYKIYAKNGAVKFLKGSFDESADLITPRPSVSIDEKFRCVNLPYMLLTGKEDFNLKNCS